MIYPIFVAFVCVVLSSIAPWLAFMLMWVVIGATSKGLFRLGCVVRRWVRPRVIPAFGRDGFPVRIYKDPLFKTS